MRTIRAIYKLELKLLLSKKIVGLLIFLLLVSFSCVQVGINKYKTVLKTITDTQRYERSKIKKYQYYGQYGTYGEIVFFQPSAQSIYFNNSSTISELTAGVDAGERLKLYNSFKGRSLFTEKSGGFMDFSGIMLLFGSGLALLLGYQSFFHKDYLRFMAGIAHKGRLFFALLASRVTLICLFLFCAGSLSLLQLLWNAVELHTFPYSYQLIYMGMVFLVGLFFYLLGTLAGSFKSRLTGFIWITSGWFVLIFFIPSGLNYF
ncbi:MAG: hypothetical protein GY765_17585, partial [bacterium]|nr:hypothetical protein [bacterium]